MYNYDFDFDSDSDHDYENHEEFRKRWRKHLGWKKCFWMDLHMFFEKICIKHLRKWHETKIWTTPIWFKLASRIEFQLRKML